MKKILISTIILLVLAACSSTRVTSSWKADSIGTQKYSKILVVGLIKESDRAIQEKMENHLAGDLKELGYNAVTSLQEYGPKAFDGMDESAVINKLKNSGVDGILTIVLLDKEKESRYIPASIHYSPFGYYHGRFWRYYGTMQNRIYEPGYYVTDTRYFWETNFYAITNEDLLYSAQMNSFDPVNTEAMAHEYGQTIVKDMEKQQVILKQ